jgi:hypothetical protein
MAMYCTYYAKASPNNISTYMDALVCSRVILQYDVVHVLR